jgi:hypothetical protein
MLPDVRDGLTRKERVILHVLSETEREMGRSVPLPLLHGRVLEHMDIGQAEFVAIVEKLVGRRVR